MNARETLEKAVKVARGDIQKNWAGLSERDRDIAELGVRRVIAAGFTIMSKEDVEAVRAAMERSIVAIDDWLHQYASDMCSEDHVKATGRRIFENGGTLAYIADVQEKNRAAIRKLKSGGGQPR